MKRILFIHAGPPKTGSTAIQKFFSGNAEAFAQIGIYWPKAGTELKAHNHLALSNAFRPGQEDHDLLAILAKELTDRGRPGRVLISAEQFGTRMSHPQYLKNVCLYCEILGYDLHVIAYIRPQPALLNSLFAQNAKNWKPLPVFDKFLQREVHSGRHDNNNLFAPLLESRTVRYTPRPYTRQLLQRDITSDFCEILGLAPQATAGFVPPEMANVVPGPKTVEAFLRLRRRIAAQIPAVDPDKMTALTWPFIRAAGALGWNDQKFWGITPSGHAALASHFSKSNDRFAERVWAKPWQQIFADDDPAPPTSNVFQPAKADPAELSEFKDFITQSMEVIRKLAGM